MKPHLYVILAASVLWSVAGGCSSGAGTERTATSAPSTAAPTPQSAPRPSAVAERGTSDGRELSPEDALRCGELADNYASLFDVLYSGSAPPEEIVRVRQGLDRLRGIGPDRVKAAVDVIGGGVSGADPVQFLETPQFEEANDVIARYLSEGCGGNVLQ